MNIKSAVDSIESYFICLAFTGFLTADFFIISIYDFKYLNSYGLQMAFVAEASQNPHHHHKSSVGFLDPVVPVEKETGNSEASDNECLN